MKTRSGFVSNSSSTSFVICLDDFSAEMQRNILSLNDMSDDLGRSTGIMKNLEEYLMMFDGQDYQSVPTSSIRQLMREKKNVVLIRESDEEMGGSFADHNIDFEEVSKKSLLEFEYH